MTSNRRSALSFALLAAVALAAPVAARAGAPAFRPATCGFYADGSGYCSGTLKAFRQSADTTAQLILQSYFNTGGAVNRYVVVQFAGVFKVLPLPSTTPAQMGAAFDGAATAVDCNIYVHWTTAGQVDALQLYNDSGLIP